jgi:hypothetical protein
MKFETLRNTWALRSGRLAIRIDREIAVNNAYTIIDDILVLGKIVAANILVDGATTAQIREFFDEPGRRISIDGLLRIVT